jgi:DNA ligase-1
MLAGKVTNLGGLQWPQFCTPKLDGIRCLVLKDHGPVTRKFKDIPNIYTRGLLEKLPVNLDGELIAPGTNFNSTQSCVMREDGEPELECHVFDYVTVSLDEPYLDRISKLEKLKLPSFCKKVLPVEAKNEKELLKLEKQYLEAGYEGLMVRTSGSPYKCGRSTEREGYLLKLKRFEDSEAIILGFEEKMRNLNEAKKDAFGRTERSSHKENLEPAGVLGTILVRDVKTGQEFGIGSGFNDEWRKEIWDHQKKYLGKLVTYKFQPPPKNEKQDLLPRFPVWKSMRSPLDISK